MEEVETVMSESNVNVSFFINETVLNIVGVAISLFSLMAYGIMNGVSTEYSEF